MTARFLSFALLLMSSLAYGSEAQLRTFLSEVMTLQAEFEQHVVDDTGMTLDFAEGKVSLSRPGKFRWDYAGEDLDESIRGQQLVADGESIFLYDPDLEQVTKRSMQDAVNQVPSLLLVEDDELLDEFFVISDIGLTDGLSWVAMKPASPDAAYQQLMLGFDGSRLAEIQMLDGLGYETRLTLSNNRANSDLPSELFEFEPPAGVDVLEE